jgi:hypothetical protein
MEGRSRYNSIQLKADKRFSHGLSIVSFYSWMHNESNTNYTLAYPGNRPLRIDPGTPPHTFSFSWTYDLPFGHERAFLSGASGILSAIVSDWNVAGALRYQSGTALAITTSNNLAPLGVSVKYANRVEGVDVYKDPRKNFDPAVDRYLNSAAFSAPSAFALGDTGGPLDYVRGFTQKSESLSFSRQIVVANGRRVGIGIDITNPFNFVRWNDPSTNLSSSAAFGTVTGTQGARLVQINLKYSF